MPGPATWPLSSEGLPVTDGETQKMSDSIRCLLHLTLIGLTHFLLTSTCTVVCDYENCGCECVCVTVRTAFVYVKVCACDSWQPRSDQPYHGLPSRTSTMGSWVHVTCAAVWGLLHSEGRCVRLLHTLKLPYTMLKDNGEWVWIHISDCLSTTDYTAGVPTKHSDSRQ